MAQLTGKVVLVLPIMEGENNGKFWQRGGLVVMPLGGNGKIVAFTAFGEKKVMTCAGVKVGDTVVVEYVPESREFHGKYFTDLNIVRILTTMWAQSGQPMVQQQGGGAQ